MSDTLKLAGVLERTRALAASSKPALWASAEPAEIVETLGRYLRRLTAGRPPENYDELRSLFLPTGPLQELSLDNGWSEEYLALAAAFDECVSRVPE